MRDKAEIFSDLSKPLDPNLVATRQERGQKLSYIEGFEAINQANKIFGFDGWGSDVLSIDYREIVQTDRQTGEVKPTGVYQAHVRITVDGFLPKTDVGVGLTAGFSPQSHETAIKAAITDGIKRALRQYGTQFGNSLYDRDNPLGEDQSSPPALPQRTPPARPQVAPAAQRPPTGIDGMPVTPEPLLEAIRNQMLRIGWSGDALVGWVKDKHNGRGPRQLTADEAKEVINLMGQEPAKVGA